MLFLQALLQERQGGYCEGVLTFKSVPIYYVGVLGIRKITSCTGSLLIFIVLSWASAIMYLLLDSGEGPFIS